MDRASKEPLSDLHILVVDDNPTFLEVCEVMLRSLGAKAIATANSGADAYYKLSVTGPGVERVVDCVLCDYNMANGNGLQLLQSVRTGQVKYFRPDASFILMTANPSVEVIETAAGLDASGFLANR